MKSAIVAVVFSVGLLAGCAVVPIKIPLGKVTSTTALASETAAERALRQSNARLQSTVVEGMVFGTATGAILGGLTSGRQGAIRGAGMGLLGGTAAGAYVAQKQAEFASKEAVLDQVLKDINRTNAELVKNIAAMRALVAERRAAIANASAEEKAAAIAQGKKNTAEMKKAVNIASQQAEFFGSARGLLISEGNTGAAAALDPQLAVLANRIATMKEISVSLG